MENSKNVDIRRRELKEANIVTNETSAASVIYSFMMNGAALSRQYAHRSIAPLREEILAALRAHVGHGISPRKYAGYEVKMREVRDIKRLLAFVKDIWLKADGLGMAA